MNYLIKKKIPLFLIRAIDQILRVLHHSASVGPINKVLLCNWAHLGDVIISTGIIPLLNKVFKDTKIGFLCSSSSSSVLQDHPKIFWIHQVDHWKLNRYGRHKIRTYLKTREAALQEVRQIGYDAAIDLYPFFPNSIPFLWQAKIPIRIGYGSGGFGPLLTHCLPWEEKNRPLIEYQLDLLRVLTRGVDAAGPLLEDTPDYFLPNEFKTKELESLDSYYLFHLGSGSTKKDWQEKSWRDTAAALMDKTIVFTGKGVLENERIERVIQGLPHCLNLCGKLSWKQLCGVVRGSAQVVTVDSAVAHLAEAYRVPTIVLFMELHAMELWKPPRAFGFFSPKPEEVVSKLKSN